MVVQLTQQKELLRETRRLDSMVIQRVSESGKLRAFQIRPTLMEEIKSAHKEDTRLQKFREQVEARLRSDVHIHTDGALYFGNKICVRQGRFDRRS